MVQGFAAVRSDAARRRKRAGSSARQHARRGQDLLVGGLRVSAHRDRHLESMRALTHPSRKARLSPPVPTFPGADLLGRLVACGVPAVSTRTHSTQDSVTSAGPAQKPAAPPVVRRTGRARSLCRKCGQALIHSSVSGRSSARFDSPQTHTPKHLDDVHLRQNRVGDAFWDYEKALALADASLKPFVLARASTPPSPRAAGSTSGSGAPPSSLDRKRRSRVRSA